MKVKDLRETLEGLPDDMAVVLSIDPEGNGYDTLDSYAIQIYSSDMREVYPPEITPDLKSQGFTEEDLYHGKDGVKALILWP